jgi:hypothetical protein
MTRDTATQEAWESLVRLWRWAMANDQVIDVRRTIDRFRSGGGGRITRMRWVVE